MQFALTEEQVGLCEVVRDVVARQCTPGDVRAARDAGTESDALRRALDDIGLGALRTPENAGGLGLGALEACLVLKELGFGGAPGPWVERVMAAQAGDSDDIHQLQLAVGAAAFLVGLGEQMLAMAVQHVQTREQFGRPIGSFQAVQHHLADARLALEFAWPLVLRAGWCLDHDRGATPTACWMAKAEAADAALLVARKTLQCHGAMGYAHEHDLQLFMKQAWELAPRFGDAATCRRNIAAAMDL